MTVIQPDRNGITDRRVSQYRRPISPRDLRKLYGLSHEGRQLVLDTRTSIEKILDGEDSRKIAIVGPCSIHHIEKAKEYAKWLRDLAQEVSDEMLVLMRVYGEKPRTGADWPGLLTEPDINGKKNFDLGLRTMRELLVYIAHLGLPVATEHLSLIAPKHLNDTISYGSIGARTTSAQTHHELVSALSNPVGIKNDLTGNVEAAIAAIKKSRGEHCFLGIDMDGYLVEVDGEGNEYGHLILRGGDRGPNYSTEQILEAQRKLCEALLREQLIVDCSHGNSGKDHTVQPIVYHSVIEQMGANTGIVGLMLESYLKADHHKKGEGIPANRVGFDKSRLDAELSATDKCIDNKVTRELLLYGNKELKKRHRTIVPV